MTDRDLFRQNISTRLFEAECKLLEEGPTFDDTLINEIRSPGYDRRYGVNLICRPSDNVIKLIQSTIDYLRDIEPHQYYYPLPDIHLTLVEVCHSQPTEKASILAKAISLNITHFLSEVATIHLDSPIISFDTKGVALNFLPTDETLQSDRRIISDKMIDYGIPLDARYIAKSAHLTLMRYICPISLPTNTWLNKLRNVPILHELDWLLDEVFISWGANWYGMRSRVNIDGPFKLGQRREPW